MGSVVVAQGQLSLAEVFCASHGTPRTWSVSLTTPDSHTVATLSVTICCRSTTLGCAGGIFVLKNIDCLSACKLSFADVSDECTCPVARLQLRRAFDAFNAMRDAQSAVH